MKIDDIKNGRGIDEELEPELRAALTDFRLSLNAWSQAAISRPRSARTRTWHWRRVLGWVLGCALVAGGLSGGLWEYHRHAAAEQARIQMLERQREEQRRLAEQKAREEEEQLLASIDTDLARQSPKALEPLAELMSEEETR